MPICITNIFYVDKQSPILIDMITQQNSQSESVYVLTAGIVLKEQKIYISKRGENQETENSQRMRNVFEEVIDKFTRRILAAPKPQKIIELETIRTLAEAGQIVIAAGGGGIPVLEQGVDLHGASAIIEKDFASGLLAEELNADTLLILTGVEKVSLNRGTDHEELLGEISAEDARKYMEADQFEKGSMLPKIEAGISFIEKGAHRRAIITDMAHAQDGYKEKTGTIIK